MQKTARIYTCDLCGVREDFDFETFPIPTKRQQQWGGIDYLGEWVDLCPKCMTKLLNGQLTVIKDIHLTLVGRGKKIEEY